MHGSLNKDREIDLIFIVKHTCKRASNSYNSQIYYLLAVVVLVFFEGTPPSPPSLFLSILSALEFSPNESFSFLLGGVPLVCPPPGP